MNERSNVNAFACSREEFKRLIEDERLQQGIIYFVGDSNTIGQGVSLAKKGTIYLATSRNRAVPFVGFNNVDELQRQFDEYVERNQSNIINLQNGQADIETQITTLSEKIKVYRWSSPSYSSQTSGEYYGIFQLKVGVSVVVYVTETANGYSQTEQLVISSSARGVTFTTLRGVGNYKVSEIQSDDTWYLLIPHLKSSREPSKSYKLAVEYYDGQDVNDIVDYTDSPMLYSGEMTDGIVIKTPSVETGATTLTIDRNNVLWSTYSVFDYIGDMQYELQEGERLCLYNSNSFDDGQIFRLTFTKNVKGGVIIKNYNGSITLCDIPNDLYAGDLITFTASTNEQANGWTYDLSRSAIVCEDGSIDVQVVGGVTHISANQQPPQSLDRKVSLSADLSFSAPAYSSANVGKYAVVLSVPINRRLTLSISSDSNGYGYFNVIHVVGGQQRCSAYQLTSDIRFAIRKDAQAGKLHLCVPCLSSQYEPRKTYNAQVLFYSESDRTEIVTPQTQTIYSRAEDAQTIYSIALRDTQPFDVSSAGVGSIDLENYSSFLGKCPSEMDSVTIQVENELAGQIYNLTFDRDITSGIIIKSGSTTYCTISETINAGDVITLTAVSNTSNGWIYSHIGTPIESPDGSIIVEISDGVTKLSVNPDNLTLPNDVIRNHSTIQDTNNDETLAVGYNSQCGYRGNVALGNSAKANGDQSVSVGTSSKTSGYKSTAIGNYSTASGDYSTASGNQSKAVGSQSTAVGYSAKANSIGCISIGENSNSYGWKSIALGTGSISNQFIGTFTKSELKDFEIDGVTCKIYKSLSNGTKVVTIDGVEYEVELRANYVLFFLSVKLDFANSLTFEIDGATTQIQGFSSSESNYIASYPNAELTNSLFAYQLPLGADKDYSPINLSIHTYFFGIIHSTSTSFPSNGIAVGYKPFTRGNNAIAIGSGASAMADMQIVIGAFNEENATDKLQIGDGTEDNRRNLVVIDQYERFICKKQVSSGVYKYNNQSTSALSFTPSDSNFKGAQTIVVSSVSLSSSSSIAMNIKYKEPIEGETLTILAKNYPLNVYDDSGSIVLIQSGKFAELIYMDGKWYSKQY